ncbi:MAG: hypothetical protein DCC59_02620 [Chloroflexi bacterium]|nr:hypothetical protein [Anaerolineales bacterium]RIK54856.1 MAG: hypothetical protein DCC59_02620 [Chloroflexota bacterium]
MFTAGPLAFQEFIMNESLPLATIQEAALEFLRGQPKPGTDWRDVAMLLLAFPDLKSETGLAAERLQAKHAGNEVLNLWADLVLQDIQPEDDEGY